jgi:hypothetical protein
MSAPRTSAQTSSGQPSRQQHQYGEIGGVCDPPDDCHHVDRRRARPHSELDTLGRLGWCPGPAAYTKPSSTATSSCAPTAANIGEVSSTMSNLRARAASPTTWARRPWRLVTHRGPRATTPPANSQILARSFIWRRMTRGHTIDRCGGQSESARGPHPARVTVTTRGGSRTKVGNSSSVTLRAAYVLG